MSGKFQRPDRQQQRTLARVAVVFAGFVAYRAMGDDRIGAGLLIWAGIVVAGFPLVERLTVGIPKERERLQIGIALVGLALVAAALALGLR